MIESAYKQVGSGTSGDSREEAQKARMFTQRILSEPLQMLFGQSVRTSASVPVRKPGLLGMKTIEVAGQYHLVCNLEPKTLGDVAQDLWQAMIP
jgi:hypothetical protein